ncbi:MAG: histidine--tRNA ligase [Hydrogenothermaceae bacterium]|nr:histidine--tRNA ligase [Hydrogenothermaceae bacterium]
MGNIQKVRGFQDIYGENARRYRLVVDTAREIFKLYNFKEIILPYLEDISLFKRSVGEETDIVQKEMYTFTDRGGRQIALRPEGTASCVRAYIEEKLYGEGGYHKLFYEGAMFRYERPQAGRYRQFHQVGAEVFGVSSVYADAEMILMINNLLKSLNIQTRLEINTLGTFESRRNYSEALKVYFSQFRDSLCETCRGRLERNPLRIIDCKVESCREIAKGSPVITDYISEESKERFEKLLNLLDRFGINYRVNPGLVRGLDYYTDTVFEFITDRIGAQGTVAAGGRYDRLVQQLGGPPTPALGFAAGVERLMLLLDSVQEKEKLFSVISLTEDQFPKALEFIETLRKNGIKGELVLRSGSLKSMMKVADKFKADFVIFVSDRCELKDMKSGEQITFLSDGDLIDYIIRELKTV